MCPSLGLRPLLIEYNISAQNAYFIYKLFLLLFETYISFIPYDMKYSLINVELKTIEFGVYYLKITLSL